MCKEFTFSSELPVLQRSVLNTSAAVHEKEGEAIV